MINQNEKLVFHKYIKSRSLRYKKWTMNQFIRDIDM